MPVMIQIRNVPDALHRKVKARAAAAGMSLSEFLLRQMERNAEVPTMEEFERRLAKRKPVQLIESSAELVRAGRDSR